MSLPMSRDLSWDNLMSFPLVLPEKFGVGDPKLMIRDWSILSALQDYNARMTTSHQGKCEIYRQKHSILLGWWSDIWWTWVLRQGKGKSLFSFLLSFMLLQSFRLELWINHTWKAHSWDKWAKPPTSSAPSSVPPVCWEFQKEIYGSIGSEFHSQSGVSYCAYFIFLYDVQTASKTSLKDICDTHTKLLKLKAEVSEN